MTNSYNLYDFLADCQGNWRNAIFIHCAACRIRCVNKERGALLVADSYGRPKVVTVTKFETVTGQRIEPTECYGAIPKDAFQSAYHRYLLWDIHDSEMCPLCMLDAQVAVVPPTEYTHSFKKELNDLEEDSNEMPKLRSASPTATGLRGPRR